MTQQFTEAPASATIRCFDPKGFNILLTLRDDEPAQLLPRLTKCLDWLEKSGYTPDAHKPSNGNGHQAANVPSCKYHGAMKPSSKVPGQFYCTGKLADGSYCKETA